MPVTAEQLTVIRAGLDASAYQAGANIVMSANQAMAASGEPVASATEKVTRAHLGAQRQLESYSRAAIEGYAEVSKFAQIQDNLTRIVALGLTTQENASNILATYASRFGLVTTQARFAAQAIQDIQIKSIAAADAMQRASQAQAAFGARSGSPGISAPVGGTGYGSSAGGGNPLYGDARAGRQADLDAYGAALDSVRAKYVPMFAAQQQYERELTDIAVAVGNGAISESEAAVAREKVAQSYLNARDAINAYAIAQRDAAALDDQRQASISQGAYNARSGALGSNPLYGAAYDARKGDLDSAFADADKQRASVDELYAASKRYEAVLEQIQELSRSGVYNDAQTDAAMKRAEVSYANQANMAGSLGLALNKTNQTAMAAGHGMHGFGAGSAFATRELIVMGDEVLRGNWTRIPGSMLVLTSHVGMLREALVGLVTSAAGLSLIGGIAGVGALTAFGYVAESNARQVETLRNRLSLIRGDYAATGQAAYTAARQMAIATGDSSNDARTGAGELFANQSFQGTADQAATVTGAFYELSKALGEQETDWKRMGAAINDPVQFLKSMQGILGDVTPALIQQAQHLQDSGDKAHAFALALKAVEDGTQHVESNMTPLQEALRKVDAMFVKADGSGKTLSKTIGETMTTAATGAVYAFGIMVAELNKFGDSVDSLNNKIADRLGIPKGGFTWAGGTGSPAPASSGAPQSGGAPSTGNIPTDAATLIYTQAEKMGIDPLVADFATRLAEQETHGHQWNPDGSVQTSSTRALGMMQVEPDDRAHGTTKTLNGQVYDLTDAVQNVQASLTMITASYHKHAGDLAEVASDYVGRGTSAAAVAERTTYLNRLHLGAASSDASSSGTYGGTSGVLPGAGAAGTNTSGVVNNSNDVIAKATELSNGSQASQLASIQDKIRTLQAALAQTGLTTQQAAAFTQELQKAQQEAYTAAVPAAQVMYRTIELQTDAEGKLAASWKQGAAAAELVITQTKAETEARAVAAPGTAAFAQTVAGLTAHYVRLAAATKDVALAQKLSTDQTGLTYIQAETNSLMMSDETRAVYLSRLKEEQELDRQGVAAGDPYRKSLVDIAGATAQANYALSTMGQTMQGGIIDGWKDITKNVNDTGDAFKSLMTDGLKGAEDAFVKFVETGKFSMHDLLQTIETDLIKLAEKTLIEQPIMAALGNGGTGNLWSALFGGAGGGAGGTATGGNVTPGSTVAGNNMGSSLLGPASGLLGIAKTISGLFGNAAVASGGLDAATAATSAITSSGQVIGGISSALPDIYHSGGVVGSGAAPTRDVPASTFYGAPRFHDGLNGDEFAAILQKGERVLTQKQDAAVTSVLKSAGGDGGKPSSGTTNIHNWNITTPDVRGFGRSQSQIAAMVNRSVNYTTARMG